jgi:ceramide glucosyltransferase
VLLNLVLLLVAVATGYQVFSLGCAWSFARWRRKELSRPAVPDARLPPVTLLKPLCGAVEDTRETLAETCRLDYPTLQIIFGVAHADDSAVAIVKQLIQEFPEVDIDLVVSSEKIGTNAKVSNLENMYRRAKHDVLVIADADIRAPRGYLRTIVPYLEEAGTGLVTCPYRASGARSVASQLEALFVNTDFAPMVTVARLVEERRYAFGATICMRRAMLEEIGGFRAIADHLADDYQLGQRVVARGADSFLAPVVVDTILDLDRMTEVIEHQLRWARTYRVCRPYSYLATTITHSTFWATLFLLLSGFTPFGASVFALAVGTRIIVGGLIASQVFEVKGIGSWLWAIPLKDLFISAIWAAAFMGNAVRWGGVELIVEPDGRMFPILARETDTVASPRPAG